MFNINNLLKITEILDKDKSTKDFYEFDKENNLYILDNKAHRNKRYKNGIKNKTITLTADMKKDKTNLKGISEIWTAFDFFMKYKDAKEFAKNVKINGHTDWRLPTDFELSDIWKIDKEYNFRLFNTERYVYPFWSCITKKKTAEMIYSISVNNRNGDFIVNGITDGIFYFNGSIILVR